MARQDQQDENYWTASSTKGFSFDSEDTNMDTYSDLFGVHIKTQFPSSYHQNKQDSIHTGENHDQSILNSNFQAGVGLQPSTSLSSLSSSSSTSSYVKNSQPTKQSLVTNKLLCSTLNVESILSPSDVIRSLFLGFSVDLNSFKKLSDKTLLLDEAIKLGDGDIVTTVLLLLQKTLHQSVLLTILKQRSSASQQYISILERQCRQWDTAELFIAMNKPQDAAVHFYMSSLKESGPKLLTLLEKLKKNQFNQLTDINEEGFILNQHIQLLQRQLPIATDDSRIKRDTVTKNISSPLVSPAVDQDSLVSAPLLATLQYCARYHWNAPENLLASPVGLRKIFSLTDRQFVWNAFVGLALAAVNPMTVLIVKSLFGTPKIAAGLSASRLLEVAARLECPAQVLDQLLTHVESPDQRCILASRYQRHRVVADVSHIEFSILKSSDSTITIDVLDTYLQQRPPGSHAITRCD